MTRSYRLESNVPLVANTSSVLTALRASMQKAEQRSPKEELHVLVSQTAPQDFPIHLRVEMLDDDQLFGLYLVARTSSWSFSAERTDLHDALSTLLAVVLRIVSGVSSSLWDVENEFTGIDTEIYARIITIEQPSGPVHRLDASGLEIARDAATGLLAFAKWFGDGEWTEWRASPDGAYRESANWREATEWAEVILDSLRMPRDSERAQWMARTNPTWKHFIAVKPRLSVLEVPLFAQWVRRVLAGTAQWQEVRSRGRTLFVGEKSQNSVARADVQRIRTVLKACEPESDLREAKLVPLENRVVGIGESHIVIVTSDSGQQRFRRDREAIARSLANDLAILRPHNAFVWNERVDGEGFEQLVLALLEREESVSRVRKASDSYDRDAGRDLIAEWITPPLTGEQVPKDEAPYLVRRVVVQCKAYARPVDKSRVVDIRDVVDHHSATGFFLAVSSSLTSGLFDHLDRLRVSGQMWVDWWTRAEIETRLQGNPDILGRFSRIVRPA